MIPELGHFALVLALALALVQLIFPLAGLHWRVSAWVALAVPVARLQALSLSLAMLSLGYAFVTSDFSVTYVAEHSNTALPLIYRISAIWGAHEGSLLLWAWTLGCWTFAVTVFSRGMPTAMRARVLAVMGLISVGFILFMLTTSNPFERLLVVPLEGQDLNPLLQDPGLAFHPPMLYMGYVGFSVVFAFAIAAMLEGRLDTAWARWSRPWTLVAWVFLTLGITLGSWWAYYELGWGGWWFWDPVENASFMPWLVGTALLHSLAVTEKRATFKAWTVLLAISAFSLSLLGTFLVRSGVLTSVHAFASDPARGVFILIFLCVVVGGSLVLYGWRAAQIKGTVGFNFFSRETALLLNNIFLVVLAASILLGTLYPLLLDALGLGKISVGPPYFTTIFVPLTVPLAMLIGIGSWLRWRQDEPRRVWHSLRGLLVIAIVVATLWTSLGLAEFLVSAWVSLVLALWVMLSTLSSVWQRYRASANAVPNSFNGMSLAHFGVGVFIVGITLTSIYSLEKDVRLAPGETYTLGDYNFQFVGAVPVSGPNYTAQQGRVMVTRDGHEVATLVPQKRVYRVQQNPMTEAAIDAGFLRDLFVALGEPRGDAGAWSLRLYYKPFIRWIWTGTVLMALGGLWAATDRRYRLGRKATVVTQRPVVESAL